MAQQTMRGIRLGNQSMESEIGVNYSPRTTHSYQCPSGHLNELVFAQDAELPGTWQCKSCAKQAVLLKNGKPLKLDLEDVRTPRSHWEMLLERRSKAELEEILKERLDYIRARRKAGKADV
ncbi:MAG: RNA polymerase-binding protein RbpA [Actinomycetota bacterium]